MAADPTLELELAICHHYRIPHSLFLGRPWPQPGQPLWLDDDADKAIGYELHRRLRDRQICPTCHTEPGDWEDERGRSLLEPKWMIEFDTCPGCMRIRAAQDEWDHAHPRADKDSTPAPQVRLRPSTPEDFLDLDA